MCQLKSRKSGIIRVNNFTLMIIFFMPMLTKTTHDRELAVYFLHSVIDKGFFFYFYNLLSFHRNNFQNEKKVPIPKIS